jgi:hypothetical protein
MFHDSSPIPALCWRSSNIEKADRESRRRQTISTAWAEEWEEWALMIASSNLIVNRWREVAAIPENGFGE